MQVNTETLRHACEGIGIDLKQVHAWKQKNLNTERLAEIGLIVSTMTVFGYMVWWVASAVRNYALVGLG